MRQFKKIFKLVSAITFTIFLYGCSSSGSKDVLNVIGSVAGEIIGTQVGGKSGEVIKKLASNTGEIASALDNSAEGEKVQAQEYEAEVLTKSRVSKHHSMISRLNEITQKLALNAPANEYSFRVRLIENEVPNALTPGGGLIIVHTGLLEILENEAQVATVLAHEIGHILKRHPKKSQRRNVGTKVGLIIADAVKPDVLRGANGQAVAIAAKATLAGYSRDQELEADRIGLELMSKAGYDVHEAPIVFQIFAGYKRTIGGGLESIFSSHPSDEKRVLQLRQLIEAKYGAEAERGGVVNTPEYSNLSKVYKERKFQRLATAN